MLIAHLRKCITGLLLTLGALSVAAQVSQVTLTDSGDTGANVPYPIPAGALEPAEAGLTAPLKLVTPTARCSRFQSVINAGAAIPFGGAVRKLEGRWNGALLTQLNPYPTEWVEEAHAYGQMYPFFKPIFSLSGVPAGPGVFELRGLSGAGAQLASVSLPGRVIAPPAYKTAAQLGATAHPRFWLTPARLATTTGHLQANDVPGQHYKAAVDYFLNALAIQPNVNDPAFENLVYDHESYIPDLALCYKVHSQAIAGISNPARAASCAAAAKTMVQRIATEYNNGTRSYAADSGYYIRFPLMYLMVAYDWMNDQFSLADKNAMITVGNNWLDWYVANGYARSHPLENYYAGYLQGRILTVLATAGDNTSAQRQLDELHRMLAQEVPMISQRACGGDWSEGWNYGPYTNIEFTLANQALLEAGENWDTAFDFVHGLGQSYAYMVSPDFTESRSFGGYSGDYPHYTSPSLLATLSGNTRSGAWAARVYNGVNAQPVNDILSSRGFAFYEALSANLSQPLDTSVSPLSYFNDGTGRFFSTSSLSSTTAYQVTAENTPYYYDHMGYASGDVRLYKGTTCLLCPAAYRGYPFRGEDDTPAFSTYIANGQAQAVDRNNQNLFVKDTNRFSAVGMRFESSYPSSRYDENLVDPANALDYLIREAVHIRPGTLVVRDLHHRRHATDTLVANWHLGSSLAVTNPSAGHWQIDTLKISLIGPNAPAPSFAPDNDAGNTRIGTLMTQTFPLSLAQMEQIAVFSETDTAVSYTGGVLTLSSGQCVTFASGTVNVAPCGCAATAMSVIKPVKSGSNLVVNWPTVGGATGFTVYRTSEAANPYSWGQPAGSVGGSTLTFSDAGQLSNATTQFYSVTNTNACGAESAQ
jgi:hypothetical protein